MLTRLSLAAALAVSVCGAALAQEPRDGGTIRFTAPYGSGFATLDILATNQSQDEIFAKGLFRSLYNWNPAAGKAEPELATSVDVSADGLTYTYHLRDDAIFHNGRAMTADDIIWTYTHIMDGAKAYPGARYVRLIEGAVAVEKGEATEISGLKKIDDHTLEMTLTEKVDPSFYFHGPTTSIYPVEAADSADFASNPVGLGPYKLAEYVPGSRIVMDKWDKFYKPVHADRIVVMPMSEAAARDIAFRNHEIDNSILGPEQYVAYQNDPELSKGILEVAEVYTRAMGMNPNFEPFTDKRVRQAINHAINADIIIEKLAKNKAYRATSWLPLSSPAYDNSLQPYAYDPEKAKALLAEAGYLDGFEFEWTATSNESWGIPIVEAIVPMLAKVGIKVKIKAVESSVLSQDVRAGNFQAFIWSLQTGPDPLATLKCFKSDTPQSACNYTHYNNPEVDKLLDEAADAPDEAAKIDALKKANAIIYDDAPYWFFNYNKAVMAYQPWLHGLQPNANELAVQNFEELWVDETSPVAD